MHKRRRPEEGGRGNPQKAMWGIEGEGPYFYQRGRRFLITEIAGFQVFCMSFYDFLGNAKAKAVNYSICSTCS